MNIVDILIIVFILLGAFIGFRDGFTKALVNAVGVIIVTVIAYVLKNPVSEILMSFMPFFNFGGITSLNIVLYEVIAFLLVFSILMIILKIVAVTTGIFETFLKFTIVLGIPSKILGAVVGAIKNYILVFFALYVLSLPTFASWSFINESSYREPILSKTPLLSVVASQTVSVFDDFASLKDKYENSDNTNEFNLETIDIFLKYKVVTPKTVNSLIDNGKLDIDGIENVLNKYEEE